jgi:hypothetical protein
MILWVEDDFGLPLPQRDSPLLFRFSLHPDDLRRLGLPRLRPSQWNVAPYLLAEAGLATLDRRRLSYSRRAAWYSRRPWYYGPFCTRRGVINTVDALGALGLTGHYRALPGDHLRTGLQSAIWLPADVMAAMIDAKDLHSQGAQPLILRARNEDRDLLEYRTTMRPALNENRLRASTIIYARRTSRSEKSLSFPSTAESSICPIRDTIES